MNTLTVKQLARTINISNIKFEAKEETYAIIYPLIGKCIITTKSDLINELCILKENEVQDMHIIRVHKSMPDKCAFAIADVAGLAYEYTESLSEGLTPYQALKEWDLI